MPRSGSVASREASPKSRSSEQPISMLEAITAATSGGSTGTLYSSRKRATVVSQLATLFRPAFRNTPAIAIRNRSWWTVSGKRPSHAVIAASRVRRPVSGPAAATDESMLLVAIAHSPWVRGVVSCAGRRRAPRGLSVGYGKVDGDSLREQLAERPRQVEGGVFCERGSRRLAEREPVGQRGDERICGRREGPHGD